MDDGAEASLALDDDVWNTHLATEGRKEDHKFNRVNIMRNNDEGCFLCFDQCNDVIETVFRVNRLFCILRGDIRSGPKRALDEQRLAFWASLPPATALAVAVRRAFFSCFVSGLYLSRSLNN